MFTFYYGQTSEIYVSFKNEVCVLGGDDSSKNPVADLPIGFFKEPPATVYISYY